MCVMNHSGLCPLSAMTTPTKRSMNGTKIPPTKYAMMAARATHTSADPQPTHIWREELSSKRVTLPCPLMVFLPTAGLQYNIWLAKHIVVEWFAGGAYVA